MVAVIAFYFTAVPVIKAVSGRDPLSAEALLLRREAMLDFIGVALFADHAHGARVLSEVLTDFPRHSYEGREK